MKIVLPRYKCISWNKLYSSPHWAIRKRFADDAHSEVRMETIGLNLKLIKKPIDITVIAHLRRRIDPDNICSKILIDALKGFVITDDSAKYVKSVTTICEKSDTDFTEIIIR